MGEYDAIVVKRINKNHLGSCKREMLQVSYACTVS